MPLINIESVFNTNDELDSWTSAGLWLFFLVQSISASLFFATPYKKPLAVSSGILMKLTFFFFFKLLSYSPCKSKVKRSPVLSVFILCIFKLQFGHYRKLGSKDWDLSPLIDSEQRLEDTGPVKHLRGDPLVKYVVISWTEQHQVCKVYGSRVLLRVSFEHDVCKKMILDHWILAKVEHQINMSEYVMFFCNRGAPWCVYLLEIWKMGPNHTSVSK